ncbi:MAG: acetoin utilization protein AcuB [Myxococcota bacterium]|jgi:acetoin utilization protein AcuB
MKIRELMTPWPHTITSEATLGDAVTIMKTHSIRHLPVTDGDDVVGIISDRDLQMALGPDAINLNVDLLDPRQASGSVDWFMTQGELQTVNGDDDVTVACQAFLTHKVGALPVYDGADLVGIISVLDIVRAAESLFAAR